MDQSHALRHEEIASDAEGIELRIELFQLAQNFRGVQIAGCFAGHDRDFHRGGINTIAHPNAMPPKKREMKTMMKKRIRSRRSLRHNSAKKSAVAAA